MAITNGGFEEGLHGSATGWSFITASSITEYAPFEIVAISIDVGYDSFDWSTALVDEYSGLYVDLTPAVFSIGPGQEDHEDFEDGWGAYTLITTISSETATFGSTYSYESFESGWGDFWADLATAGSTSALFDSGTVAYDAMQWYGAINDSFSPAELTEAEFDNGGLGTDPYETFDAGDWPALTL